MKRWFGRSAPPAFVESRLERLSHYPPMPPPPPPMPLQDLPASAKAGAATGAGGSSRVKLILEDGTESALPAEPDVAARAAYLVHSMLPPRPPGPGEGSS